MISAPEVSKEVETEATEYAAVYPGNGWKMVTKKAGLWQRKQGVGPVQHDIGFEPIASFARVWAWLMHSPMSTAGRDPPATVHTVVASNVGPHMAIEEMQKQRDEALKEVNRLQNITMEQIAQAVEARVAALRAEGGERTIVTNPAAQDKTVEDEDGRGRAE